MTRHQLEQRVEQLEAELNFISSNAVVSSLSQLKSARNSSVENELDLVEEVGNELEKATAERCDSLPQAFDKNPPVESRTEEDFEIHIHVDEAPSKVFDELHALRILFEDMCNGTEEGRKRESFALEKVERVYSLVIDELQDRLCVCVDALRALDGLHSNDNQVVAVCRHLYSRFSTERRVLFQGLAHLAQQARDVLRMSRRETEAASIPRDESVSSSPQCLNVDLALPVVDSLCRMSTFLLHLADTDRVSIAQSGMMHSMNEEEARESTILLLKRQLTNLYEELTDARRNATIGDRHVLIETDALRERVQLLVDAQQVTLLLLFYHFLFVFFFFLYIFVHFCLTMNRKKYILFLSSISILVKYNRNSEIDLKINRGY